MNENESDLGAFLAGFVIGALVGAATALILAPQSGQATRQQLAGISSDLRYAGSEQLNQARNVATTYTREFSDKASTLVSDTRERAQTLGDQMQDQMRIVLDAGKEAADEVVNTIDESDTAG